MVVIGPSFHKEIYYKRFAKDPCPKRKKVKQIRNSDGVFTSLGVDFVRHTDCIPLPQLYKVRSFGRASFQKYSTDAYPPRHDHASGFGFLEDQVFVSLMDGVYFFKPDGRFVEKRKEEDEWWVTKEGPFGTPDWNIANGFRSELFYKKRKINADRGKAFSGPVVAVFHRPRTKREEREKTEYPEPEIVDLSFLDRKTGKVKKVFPALRMSAMLNDMRLREYGEGFYLDRQENKYDRKTRKNYYLNYIYTPMFWFGEKTIDLRSEDAEFCYVFNEEKKCVPNPAYLIEAVIEDEHALYVMTFDKIYVKRKSERN